MSVPLRLREVTVASIVASALLAAPAAARSPLACFELPTADLDAHALERVRAIAPLAVRIESAGATVLCLEATARTAGELGAALARAGFAVRRAIEGVAGERLIVVRGVRRVEAEALGRVILGGGRAAVVELAPERSLGDPFVPFHARGRGAEPGRRLADVATFAAPEVVLARLASVTTGPVTPALDALVASVDGGRWLAAATALAGWNRWTRGSEILEARDWLLDRFAELPGMEVWTESFPVTTSTGWNVFARLAGTVEPATWFLVGGHYDSTSENPAVAAPGAEDNASGCAGVLELARAFAATPPPETLLFVCYAGEEQGLYGSEDHVADLLASGGDAGFGGALIYDMIGYDGDATLDVLLETGAAGQPLLDLFAAASTDYAGLVVSTSLFPFGSDHVPYLQEGLPALLAIENDWDEYPDYHRTTDLPANLSIPMGEGIVRMGAAGIGRLAGLAAPPGLLFRDGWERGDLSAWSAVGSDP